LVTNKYRGNVLEIDACCVTGQIDLMNSENTMVKLASESVLPKTKSHRDECIFCFLSILLYKLGYIDEAKFIGG